MHRWPASLIPALALAAALLVPAAASAQGSCRSNADCNDGRFCNGTERCASIPFGGGFCIPGLPACVGVFCNETTDRCEPRCTSNAQCDDGLFCNGIEACSGNRCYPGIAPDCDDAFACSIDSCDESMRQCTHAPPDADRDGHGDARCFGDDCDDADPLRHPGRTEVCDSGRDEDCDDTTIGSLDQDGDGHIDADCCNVTSTASSCGADCNDDEDGVHPGVPEVCNQVDDDCNGSTDEGAQVLLFLDRDGDGHGAAGEFAQLGCAGDPGMSSLGNDCDDKYPAIQPGALICNPVQNDQPLLCSSTGDFVLALCPQGSRCISQPNRTGTCQACDACTPPGDPLPPPP